MGYLTTNLEDNTMYDLYIQGDGGIYANPNSKKLFYDLKNVDSITGLNNLNTSRVFDMSYMFYKTGYNSTIFTLDLGNNFDTSKVSNMDNMFSEAGFNSTVFSLELGDKFDTYNVTDISNMFYDTGYLNNNLELDLSKFDFSNVSGCIEITGFSLPANTFSGFKATQKIWVKDANSQAWVIAHGGSNNLTTANVLIKS